MLLMCLCYSPALMAHLNLTPKNITMPLTWSGMDITATQVVCVVSTNNANPSGTDVIPYGVLANAPLELSDGVNTIPVSLLWQDLTTMVSTTLSGGVATAEVMTGKTQGCPGGNNARVRLQVNNSDITAVPPSTYSANLRVDAFNSGSGKRKGFISLNVTLVVPDSVRISQLSDIALGSYTGVDINVTESLCVFRASGGNYGVTITGSGAGGAFELSNGSSVLPFGVSWNDGTGAVALTPGVLLGNRINSVTGSDTCNNGALNNATLGVSLLAADVNVFNTQAGVHSGALVIMIEMQ